MKQLLNVYKPQGLTPLQTIEWVRKKFPEYFHEKIGFAGRLDPLAHGVLLLMIGEETTKAREEYLNLPKHYEFEAVFGVATDTYDALGIIQNNTNPPSEKIGIQNIRDFIHAKLGKQTQTYPPYSSKTVQGKPLYLWARENRLGEIAIPSRQIEIYDFKLLTIQIITAAQLHEEIFKQIDSVTGDFRQKEIKMTWQTFFLTNKTATFQRARFVLSCSSGTYIRSLVNELGEKLGGGAFALEIVRTKVGDYTRERALRFT